MCGEMDGIMMSCHWRVNVFIKSTCHACVPACVRTSLLEIYCGGGSLQLILGRIAEGDTWGSFGPRNR